MYLPFTILAYFLNGTALLIDKFLLSKAIPNPLTYVFYISAFSLPAIFLLPFTNEPSGFTFALASSSTLLWTLGAYFMFSALQTGQVSRVIPAIGTLTPLFLLIYAWQTSTVSINGTWAATILLLGLALLTLNQWKGKIKMNEIMLEVLSSLGFAVSYLILKEAYLTGDFLTVLVYSRWILLPAGATALLFPKFRRLIFTKGSPVKFLSRSGALFALGQSLGGASQLLLTFSIFLASPVLVSSLQGLQYVFLFFAGLFLAKKLPAVFKKESASQMTLKIAGIALIGFGLYVLAFAPEDKPAAKFGVTYSHKYARELGLDEKVVFTKILDGLQVKTVRLPVYWDEIETFPGKFNFGIVDFYLNEALKRNTEVILVLGYKQPRWPECFAPEWVKRLTREEREKRILELVAKEVEHFRIFPNISAWQIENEPFLSYGDCDQVNNRTQNLLIQEIETVKNADLRPILITDSGELSTWRKSIKYGDWFGATLYRTVWTRYLGTQDYPLPPFFYSIKEKIVRTLTSKDGQSIISELQAEPWPPNRDGLKDLSADEQTKLLSLSKLKGTVEYAKETGFSPIYLWGVEWWYYMAENNHPEYLEFAKSLF